MTTLRAKTRRKRFQPSKPLNSISVTERDRRVLKALERYRFLSSNQLERITEGSSQKLRRRLRDLFDHGYVDRPRAQLASVVHGNRPMIYGLGDKGAKYLGLSNQRQREQNQSRTNFFVNHTVETAEFFIELESAATQQDISIIHEEDMIGHPKNDYKGPGWPVSFRWRGGRKTRVHVTPDGVFGLIKQDRKPAYYFVEIDRGTEPIQRSSPRQSSILKKMLAYKETHLGKASGLPNFRVLFVTTTQRRIDAMIDAIPEGTPKGLFLFSTLEQASRDPLSACWRNAKTESGNQISIA